jgi:hypothetical protein
MMLRANHSGYANKADGPAKIVVLGPPKKMASQRARQTRSPKGNEKMAIIVRFPDMSKKRFASMGLAASALGLDQGNVSRGLNRTGFYHTREGHVLIKEEL